LFLETITVGRREKKQSPQGKKAMTGLGKFLALKSKKEIEKPSLEIANAILRSYGKCAVVTFWLVKIM
jgi:hypothetical protein